MILYFVYDLKRQIYFVKTPYPTESSSSCHKIRLISHIPYFGGYFGIVIFSPLWLVD